MIIGEFPDYDWPKRFAWFLVALAVLVLLIYLVG